MHDASGRNRCGEWTVVDCGACLAHPAVLALPRLPHARAAREPAGGASQIVAMDMREIERVIARDRESDCEREMPDAN